MTNSKHRRQIRYAVVGLGHIAQVAVLPAFAHARANSQLIALVSDDAQKRKTLGRRYQVDHLFSYREYDECLRSGIVDAVYIAYQTIYTHSIASAPRGQEYTYCAKSPRPLPRKSVRR